jgi:hypothetical protein
MLLFDSELRRHQILRSTLRPDWCSDDYIVKKIFGAIFHNHKQIFRWKAIRVCQCRTSIIIYSEHRSLHWTKGCYNDETYSVHWEHYSFLGNSGMSMGERINCVLAWGIDQLGCIHLLICRERILRCKSSHYCTSYCRWQFLDHCNTRDTWFRTLLGAYSRRKGSQGLRSK